jgi:hypothetical protein
MRRDGIALNPLSRVVLRPRARLRHEPANCDWLLPFVERFLSACLLCQRGLKTEERGRDEGRLLGGYGARYSLSPLTRLNPLAGAFALLSEERVVRAFLFLRCQETAQISFNIPHATGRRLDSVNFVEFLYQTLVSMANDRELGKEIDWYHCLTFFDDAHQPGYRIEVLSRQGEFLNLEASSLWICDLHRNILDCVVDFDTESEVVLSLE